MQKNKWGKCMWMLSLTQLRVCLLRPWYQRQGLRKMTTKNRQSANKVIGKAGVTHQNTVISAMKLLFLIIWYVSLVQCQRWIRLQRLEFFNESWRKCNIFLKNHIYIIVIDALVDQKRVFGMVFFATVNNGHLRDQEIYDMNSYGNINDRSVFCDHTAEAFVGNRSDNTRLCTVMRLVIFQRAMAVQ